MTTRHVVADDQLGSVTRRRWEIERRLMEGALDPVFVARGFQQLAEGKDVIEPPVPAESPFFADDEVITDYRYPAGYIVKPIQEQLVELSRHFPNLDPCPLLAYSKELPQLPRCAEGWFIIPRWEKVCKSYSGALMLAIEKINESRNFYANLTKSDINWKFNRLSERTANAFELLWSEQKSDFLAVPAQFGARHVGCSARRAHVLHAHNEFGLGAFAVACMLLTHPERFYHSAPDTVGCLGDLYVRGELREAILLFDWQNSGNGGFIFFDCGPVNYPNKHCGFASGFLPSVSR